MCLFILSLFSNWDGGGVPESIPVFTWWQALKHLEEVASRRPTSHTHSHSHSHLTVILILQFTCSASVLL